jgi:hypothetical protein
MTKVETALLSSFQLSSENECDMAACTAEANIAQHSKLAKQGLSSSSVKRLFKSTIRGTMTSSLTPAVMSPLEKTKWVPSQSQDVLGSAL